jgi:sensor histidine kinase YesM
MLAGFGTLFVISLLLIYWGFYRSTIETIQRTTEDSLKLMSGQLVQQIDKTFDQMRTIARIFAIDPKNRERLDTRDLSYLEQLRKYWVVDEQFKIMSAYFSDYYIAVYLRKDSLLAWEDMRFLRNDLLFEADELQALINKTGQYFWKADDLYQNYLNTAVEGISYYESLGSLSGEPTDQLVIRLGIAKDNIKKYFRTGENTTPVSYYLLDEKESIFLTDDKAPKTEKFIFRELPEYIKAEDRQYRVFYDPIRTNGWWLATIIPTDYYNQALLGIQLFFLALVLLLFGAFLVVMVMMMNSLVRIENEKNRSRLVALQTQIKPHFIYNTLDSINWMALDKGNLEVSRAIVHLANFLRKTLPVDNGQVTVEEELEQVKGYVDLMNTRSEYKVNLETDINEAVRSSLMVKFLLQPVVENAIIHGFYPLKRRDGVILITGRPGENQTIEITVTDNGGGFVSGETFKAGKKRDEERNGFGLDNVEYRLRLFYGKNSGITVESWPGTGTRVTIHWPREQKNNRTSHLKMQKFTPY